MRRSTLATLCLALLLGQSPLAAQSTAIAAIRAHYQEVQALIGSGSPVVWRDTFATNVSAVPSPGTGPVRAWLTLYARVEYAEAEHAALELVLVKAENTAQVSGTVFYEEYLFSASGELEFYYRKRGLGDGERADLLQPDFEERLYFADGKLIRTVVDGVTSDAPDEADRAHGESIRRKARAVAALEAVRASIPPAAADPE